MRNELKFKSNYQYLKELIIISDYKKHHPSRYINSIYFDDVDLSLFKQSEEGSVPRFKLRYRWYGKQNFSSVGNLEKKITYEQFRDKIIRKIKNCKYKFKRFERLDRTERSVRNMLLRASKHQKKKSEGSSTSQVHIISPVHDKAGFETLHHDEDFLSFLPPM